MRKTALTIAGSDSSGGAGIIANPNTHGTGCTLSCGCCLFYKKLIPAICIIYKWYEYALCTKNASVIDVGLWGVFLINTL